MYRMTATVNPYLVSEQGLIRLDKSLVTRELRLSTPILLGIMVEVMERTFSSLGKTSQKGERHVENHGKWNIIYIVPHGVVTERTNSKEYKNE